MPKGLILPPEIKDVILKHLKRAGHDRLGEAHVVYPKPGEWDIEQDEPGCNCGLWLVNEEGAPRTQCDVCTCGYSDVLNLFDPGYNEKEME